MLTVALFTAIGAYFSRRIDAIHDDEIASVSLNYQQIVEDAIAFFALIGFICNWAISTGRNTRICFNEAILPWLEQRGISIQLPTIELPALPSTQIE